MPLERLSLPRMFGPHTDWTRFPWQPYREGVEIARLYGEAAQGPTMALLRYQPGASEMGAEMLQPFHVCSRERPR